MADTSGFIDEWAAEPGSEHANEILKTVQVIAVGLLVVGIPLLVLALLIALALAGAYGR